MKRRRAFAFGMLLGMSLSACAAFFPYKYYGIDCKECQGTLLGKAPKDDIPLTACKPDAQVKGKCVVLFVDEFERLRADLIEYQKRLEACEVGQGA